MIEQDRAVIFDIDETLAQKKGENQAYIDLKPIDSVVEKLREYHEEGVWIILLTSRQMRTYEGNVGQITAHTGKVLFEWLDKWDIPYDELHFGKPWPGHNGFYVDDRAVRPSEIVGKTYNEVLDIIEKGHQKL